MSRKMGFRYILGWLIVGTRGGITRGRIIKELKMSPYNANQISNILHLDYRTTRHHLDVLLKNKLITIKGEGYGQKYHLSTLLEENYFMFENFFNRIWEKQKRKKRK